MSEGAGSGQQGAGGHESSAPVVYLLDAEHGLVREGGVQSYRDLHVWQGAIDLVEGVYHNSAGFPDDERFGLTAQIRRAAVSIPSNIALTRSLR